MKHQHLVHALNRRAANEAENARIDELERKATPAIYAVLFAALLVVVGNMSDEYADSKHAGSIRTAQIMADCMNGKAIQADGSILRCDVVSYALVGEK
ncbi:MAG TPA: hypothetical protein VIY48_06385 [Candidatus Paceibacterota bacterium]